MALDLETITTDQLDVARQALGFMAAAEGGNLVSNRVRLRRYVINEWLKWVHGDDQADTTALLPGELFTDQGNHRVIFQARDEGGNPINTGNTRHMALHIGKRDDSGLILLNGDGMDIARAMEVQTWLREYMREMILPESNRVLLIPFQALTAAQLDYQTIQPIHIMEDEQREVSHIIPDPPEYDFNDFSRNPNAVQRGGATFGENDSGIWEIRHNNYLYRLDVSGANVKYRYVRDHSLEGGGPAEWRRMTQMDEGAWWSEVDGERPPDGTWRWVEDRHMLGATVFSVIGPDRRRHRWVSAFDQNEANPLYFLAQLPDKYSCSLAGVPEQPWMKGKCETYSDALNILAPEIVHETRAEGRIVERQGDLFFIETPLTTEQIYSRAKYRVRRTTALFDLPQNIARIATRGVEEPMPEEGEVSEQIDCPCGCGHKRRTGAGPLARRTLSIYRTGHTADEVVVTKEGVTFCRGSVYHDPQLEAEGRGPDHAARMLDPNSNETWFLAVRNTVPRQTAVRPTEVTDSLVDTFITMQAGGHKQRRDKRRTADAAKKVREAAAEEITLAEEVPVAEPALV